jgi:hypothetical protein
MRLHRTILAPVAVSLAAVVIAVGAAPAPGVAAETDRKTEAKGRLGASDQRLLRTESAAAGAAAARVNPVADKALGTIQSRIATFVRANGTKHTFGSYLDSATGKVVVETDAPDSVVAPLVGTAASGVQVRRAVVADSYSRRADIPAFWGGAGVTASVGSAWCSTGFTVKNGVGTRSMVTAGHCFSNGTNVFSELGGVPMGTVSGNGLPVAHDMELIGGKSYGSSIYVGGVNSSTGNPVVAAADPVVGFTQYCHSGRTTGENCGHTATSVTAQVCTQSGCKSPVIAFTGGVLPQGGDSGSPFYAKSGTNIHIRGIIIAVGGGTAYAEKWSRIANRYGVTIAT